jgi:hypothetical protein
MEQDTSPAQQEAYYQRLRKLTPVERLQIVSRLNRGVRRLAMIGLRMQHPGASEEEVRVRLVVRLYGREFAERHCDNVPADAE